MIPIFIASTRSYSGKTFIALGIALKLMELGYNVGYMKPFGRVPVKKESALFDADAVFIKEALSLNESFEVISPFVLEYETQNLIFDNKIKNIKPRIIKALNSMKKKDFIIIGGGADLFDGAVLNIDALSIAKEIKARVLMVESWIGDMSADSLLGAARLLKKDFMCGVINRVPVNSFEHVDKTVKPFLEKKGVNIFGVFEKDSVLESFTTRQLTEILNGKILCCENRLDEFIENFLIGAMDVDSALRYFRRVPNKAVITGAHRSDIQLAAMETSTKCIIITGGLYANDVVIAKAEAEGVPIISVAEDTFTVIDRIEAIMGKTRIRGKQKIQRAKELIDKKFNINAFLENAGKA
ncbi:MAG: phosphotransacetylase family protein [Nitrospiraceae bacterium]|nr:phosphotransacetylase family protein [Nitrospiraceae bacterium]